MYIWLKNYVNIGKKNGLICLYFYGEINMGLYVIKFFIEIIGFDIIKKLRMIFFYELFYFGN